MSATGRTVGVDVGGSKVLGVLLDEDLTVLHSVRLATVHGPDGVVGSVVAAVERLCTAGGVLPASLLGVGVGVPGLVDPRTGTVGHAVNLGLHEDLGLAVALADRLGVATVQVENDLTVAALGAARVLGAGRPADAGSPDLAYLALGTGVAAGLLLDGQVRRGYAGAAGEIGHLPYRPDGELCACGQRGCLELYASGAALRRRWAAAGGLAGGSAFAHVFAAAAAGTGPATVLLEEFADAVATAVRHLVLVCDVEHVVLGGGVAEVGGQLVDVVRLALARQAAGSAFLRRLAIADRLVLLPPGASVAPVGAALAVRRRTAGQEAAWRS